MEQPWALTTASAITLPGVLGACKLLSRSGKKSSSEKPILWAKGYLRPHKDLPRP